MMGKVKGAKKFKQPVVDNSRKAQRKQKRLQKKVHRQEHYLKKKSDPEQSIFAPGRFVKRPAEDTKHEPAVKKKKPKLQPSVQDILSMERDKEIKEANKLKSEMEHRRKDMLLKANEDEDKLIKKLEKQLGLNKSKNKNNFFANDGLDYLLEICDRSTTEQIVAAEKHLAQVEGDSDFDEDLAMVTGKEIPKDGKKKQKHEEDNDNKIDNDSDEQNSDNIQDSDCDNDEEIDDSGQEISEDEELSENGDPGDENNDLSEDEVRDIDENSMESEPPEEKPTKSQKQKVKKSTEKAAEKSKSATKSKAAKSKERIIKADELSKVFSDDEISHLSGDDEISHLSGDDEISHLSGDDEISHLSGDDEISHLSGDDEISHLSGDDEISHLSGDDEISHLSGDDDDEDLKNFSGDEGDDANSKKKEENPNVWEDIYGRKRDKEGNIIKEEKGVYIPPHLRNKDSSSDKQLAQLKRQIKSVLNKLAGTNLHWASTSMENLYSNNSRNSVNTALTQLWLEATVAPSMTPDRLVAEHAALVSVLHANVGSEIGAHFLQELVKRFDAMLETPQPVEDKQLDNLVACLANLYNFKIFDAPLLVDILNRLVTDLNEKCIDCALVALRCCGATLRKNAPKQLQQLVQDVQPRAAGLSEGATSGSRIKFLLEVLMAIKNNNLMKIPNYDPTYQEHLKKVTKTIVRKGNYVTPLNIRLEDLLKADERGKWWVVGSAWEGSARDIEAKTSTVTVPTQDQKLLELARKQRMNTDVRRSIFCVIMAAEDYMDAFEKLQHLGLKGPAEREVAAVVLACCLHERQYNPYYAVLATKLAATDRKYQLALQFAVWDKIKDLENQSKQCLTNLAQFLTHLIMEKGLPLSVLKIIQFSDLNKHSVKFMRQMLLAIIMNENLQASLEVFHRIAKPPKLHMFRESLRLFIQHFLLKNAGKKSSILSDQEMTVLKERAGEVHRILTMFESKLQF